LDFQPIRAPRFSQIATFLRLPHVQDITGLDIAVLGVPFDGGSTYRPGSRFAPREIRQSSSLMRRYNPVLDVYPFKDLRIADAGDIDVPIVNIEEALSRITAAIQTVVEAGVLPLCVGGDHSISLPILRAVARRYGPVALLHVDAHQDMWDDTFGNRYTHSSPFRRAAEESLVDFQHAVQIGIRGSLASKNDLDFAREHGVKTISARSLARLGPVELRNELAFLRGRPLYVSFDIDSVDPAYAPGTGTPEIGGLTSREAVDVLHAVLGCKIVGADIVEVSPPYDHGCVTAVLAANILFEIVSLVAASRRHIAHQGP